MYQRLSPCTSCPCVARCSSGRVYIASGACMLAHPFSDDAPFPRPWRHHVYQSNSTPHSHLRYLADPVWRRARTRAPRNKDERDRRLRCRPRICAPTRLRVDNLPYRSHRAHHLQAATGGHWPHLVLLAGSMPSEVFQHTLSIGAPRCAPLRHIQQHSSDLRRGSGYPLHVPPTR